MFHDLLGVLLIVKPVIPALHSLWCGVGDILRAVRPAHFVALAFHQSNELFLGRGIPHALIDGVHQSELPAFTLGGRTVFPAAHALGLFRLLLLQNRKTVFHTKLVRECAQVFQSAWSLPKHFPGFIAYRIDNEMRMDVFGVRVRGDKHLTVRPRLLGKLPRHLVCQRSGDLLIRREGLDIVIEPNRTVFPMHLPGGNELLSSQLWRTVLSADQLPAVLLLGFLFLRHIACHSMKRSSGLTLVSNECNRSHQVRSCSASSRSLR